MGCSRLSRSNKWIIQDHVRPDRRFASGLTFDSYTRQIIDCAVPQSEGDGTVAGSCGNVVLSHIVKT